MGKKSKVTIIRDAVPAEPHTCHSATGERCDICFELITAPVTTAPSVRELLHLTEEEWNALDIPQQFLRTASPPEAAPSSTPTSVDASVVRPSDGKGSGSLPNEPTETSPSVPSTDEFAHFRVDPKEIESKIKHEADRRWRAWVPTKDHLSRPRMSYYLKQVRKEYYP